MGTFFRNTLWKFISCSCFTVFMLWTLRIDSGFPTFFFSFWYLLFFIELLRELLLIFMVFDRDDLWLILEEFEHMESYDLLRTLLE